MLVPIQNEHVHLTFEWVKESELQRLFLMRGKITWEGHQAYFKRVLSDPKQCIFAILVDDTHVGNCGLKNLSVSNKRGEIWIYIGDPSMREKGIGKRATELLIHEGFEVLGLEMVYIHVAEFNTAALRMYEKIGFIEVPLQIGENDEWENRGCKIIRMELKKPK